MSHHCRYIMQSELFIKIQYLVECKRFYPQSLHAASSSDIGCITELIVIHFGITTIQYIRTSTHFESKVAQELRTGSDVDIEIIGLIPDCIMNQCRQIVGPSVERAFLSIIKNLVSLTVQYIITLLVALVNREYRSNHTGIKERVDGICSRCLHHLIALVIGIPHISLQIEPVGKLTVNIRSCRETLIVRTGHNPLLVQPAKRKIIGGLVRASAHGKHIILLQPGTEQCIAPIVMIEQPGGSIHLTICTYQFIGGNVIIVIAAELLVDKIGCSIFGSLFHGLSCPHQRISVCFPGSLVIILYSDSGIFGNCTG